MLRSSRGIQHEQERKLVFLSDEFLEDFRLMKEHNPAVELVDCLLRNDNTAQ